MNYFETYKKRASFLGTTPQERAFQSGILEFRRYLKYNSHTVRGLICETTGQIFDGVILTDKEDENRVSQILLVDLETPLKKGDLILWNNEHWLIYRSTTSSYQPHQKFYMVRCNYYIKWVDNGELKESWIYLLGSKDSKIKDNFRTWHNVITPQPNKYIEIILPHVLMPINTEIIVMDEAWYLVDYDQNSVPGVIFMSFTETKINEQRDDLENKIANADQIVIEEPEDTKGIVGKDMIKVGYSAKYELLNAEGDIKFSISDKKLATIEYKTGSNICTVKANENNKLGFITLTAECNETVFTKQIEIIPLWKVS